ncbi:glycosyl transferase family 2 [Cyclobacterium marinum DSM 745]|uniref:Glycosyl transferase family 2 n=2 Tax=Cyclobacterium marinum TaxID=104 RepID=G0J673_CYCMS|nr:glycosyl transferase family 2 [Cyclobacterium marinum DSM 745]
MKSFMKKITVIILTFNEERHIARCITSLGDIAETVFLIDCFSNDRTVEIAKEKGAIVVQREWPGNQANQFNWALQNLPIQTEWVFRLDADEILLPELVDEIKNKVPLLDNDITGVVLKRRHYFFNKWVKRGVYPVKLLRLFRFNKAKCEQRWMDEHIQLLEGQAIEFENDFVDHNLHDIHWWIQKHNGYATREAIELLDVELNLLSSIEETKVLGDQAVAKREKKLKYAKQPLFLRSFAYFLYRYIFKLGFLDGKEGFLWNFFQGWWYRTLVDAKIYEIRKSCGKDKEKIKKFIKITYKIDI